MDAMSMPAPMLDRREFVRRLLIARGDLLVISGLGSATYDVAAAGDHALNFYLWGAMGGTAMIGLGLALGAARAPGRRHHRRRRYADGHRQPRHHRREAAA
jgi:hypothetical protein